MPKSRRQRMCRGKIRHAFLQDATEEAKRLTQHHDVTYTAYVCDFCGAWHCGAKRPNQRPVEQAEGQR